MHDVIIVGGGIAGLAAATQLGRARRKVLVLDTGLPRNRYAPASHGFLTRDGATPEALRAEASRQLEVYGTIERRSGAAVMARGGIDGFELVLDDGSTVGGRRLILAHGVIDDLGWLPGLEACWGKTAIHCPYCHGYEVADRRLGFLFKAGDPLLMAKLYRDWSRDLTIFTTGHELPPGAREALMALGVGIVDAAVIGFEHDEGRLRAVVTIDGPVACDAIFVHAPTRLASPVAEQLGCRTEAGFNGPYIAVTGMQATSVPGVFAAGDAARQMHSITFAAADGVAAGSGAHHSLL